MPFADKSGPLEQGILNQAGHISRRPQAAVRGLSQPVWPMKISFCRARISPSSIRLFAKREPPSFLMRRGKELLWSYRTLCAIACRSEEHTSELQSLMRISYAVLCLKKKNTSHRHIHIVNILHTS